MATTSKVLTGCVVVEVIALVVLAAEGGTFVGRLARTVAALTGLVVLGALRAHRDRTAAGLALVLGLVGLAVGSGVGPRHLAAEITLRGVAGGVVLVAGLALVVLGAVGLSRGVRRRWWLVSLPVGVMALLLLLPTAIAVAASDPPPTPLGDASPTDLGLPATTVAFPARDGTPLEGWWVPGWRGDAVILLHGSGSNRASVLGHMAALAEAGHGVFAYDARGHGGSGGDGMDLGWNGPDDLRGAIDHVVTLPGVDPTRVAVVGLSMGGEVALSTSGDPRVRAVVAEGATRRSSADDAWLPEHAGGRLQRAMDQWQDLTVSMLTGLTPPPSLRDLVASGTAPVLLVTAGSVPDERAAAEWIASAAPDRVHVWTVSGVGHTGALDARPDEWRANVLGFLDQALPAR